MKLFFAASFVEVLSLLTSCKALSIVAIVLLLISFAQGIARQARIIKRIYDNV